MNVGYLSEFGALQMRAIVQRVKQASVKVEGEIVGEIGMGLLVLLGAGKDDSEIDAQYLADKITNLRIFDDEDGKLNKSVLDIGGEVLSVSQFTLYGDARKGNRPSFAKAADPKLAERLCVFFKTALERKGLNVAEGRFRARMEVALINSGPVTIMLDSTKEF